MSETISPETIERRLVSLQNNVSGVNRRLITLESNLADRIGALEARMTGLEDRAERLVDHLRTVESGLNSLILLVQQLTKAQARKEAAP